MQIIINKSFKLLINYVSTIAIGLNEYYGNVTLYDILLRVISITISASMCK